MTLFNLYLMVTVIPNLGATITILAVVSLVFAVFITIICFECATTARFLIVMPKLAILFAVSLFLGTVACLCPNREEMAVIIAGNWASNSAEIKKLPDNVVKTMNDFLESHQKKEEKGK